MSKVGRYSLNLQEATLEKNDLVILSDYNLWWRVTHVSRDGVSVYLISELGGRHGVVHPARIKAAWRDLDHESEIDWTRLYENDEQ